MPESLPEPYTLVEVNDAEADDAGMHLLISCLGSQYAAARAGAARRLLQLFGKSKRIPKDLANAFGEEADAFFGPHFFTLAQAINWQPTAAWMRFLDSRVISADNWRDGELFDLTTLPEMHQAERDLLRHWLRHHLRNPFRTPDPRELRLAADLGETALLEILAKHGGAKTRLIASALLGDDRLIVDELCQVLRESDDFSTLSRALDEVSAHPTGEVKKALIAYLRRNGELFVPAAMVLLETFGGVADAFPERPFLFEVKDQGPDGALWAQLMARVGAA